MHRSEFLQELKQLFPELTRKINAEEGLLHFEVAVVHQYATERMKAGDHRVLDRCFELMERAHRLGNPKLQNAVDVSFVEGLPFLEHPWAWRRFPESLKRLYVAFHGAHHVDKISIP